jgi:tRNA1Val (adenine37-N6)-methyltransferase
MPNDFFHFKQFSIYQDRCAMKVGTDGVLLGAWANAEHTCRILDIGTGTGLIALMLAQRTRAFIDAIEIDGNAADQARENIQNSPWSDRVNIYQCSFQEYSLKDVSYDLIVTNPPYFTDFAKMKDSQRMIARQNYMLSLDDLISGVCRMMSPAGRFALIYPDEFFTHVVDAARSNGLFPLRITRVKPAPEIAAKRVLAEFSREQNKPENKGLIIEEAGRHNYSEVYKKLTHDFYLNF